MTFDLGSIRAAHKRFIVANERMMDTVMREAKAEGLSRIQSHPGFTRRTGKTQGSVKGRVLRRRGGRKLVFRSNRNTALWMDKGTRPHPINHPGTRPYRFMRNARDYAFGRVGSRLMRHMRRIARNF